MIHGCNDKHMSDHKQLMSDFKTVFQAFRRDAGLMDFPIILAKDSDPKGEFLWIYQAEVDAVKETDSCYEGVDIYTIPTTGHVSETDTHLNDSGQLMAATMWVDWIQANFKNVNPYVLHTPSEVQPA